ncbi:hypothetical protein [Fluviicola sp.]|jgi:hypothetical protein|uniref:hypothetical protein n=1 Tax=Fluviicola sp. TaxID=1917219 RepID=UPI002828F8F5|nr:hypothetical protein [Fluviicola sp.]MDR0801417.1 hypothetical protein [Fluviicola sp.]
MRLLLNIFLSLILASSAWGQRYLVLPIESYFRDVSFFTDSSFAPVFPVNDQQVNYYNTTKEQKLRYSSVGYYIYQRELIQLSRKEGTIRISPILDLQTGVERGNTSRQQYLNVRGVRIEGSMKNKVFFSGSFYENQAVFPYYVQQYVNNRGEFYPNMGDSGYYQVNAVIPGGARTKPFKTNGFDYAYATGIVQWQVLKNLAVSVGNSPIFIGSGYRSVLYSDNALPTMNFRINYSLGEKWNFQLIRMQGLNMLRIPFSTNGEALYERKGLSLGTIYFQPTKHLRIGLVEGGIWARGDSLQKQAVEGGFYIPIPGAATIQEGINGKSYAYLGLDFNWRVWKLLVYGQYGRNPYTKSSDVGQIGLRYWPFRSHHYLIHIEYNHTSANAYKATNPRIDYSNFNLPVGHPMAAGVDELVVRLRAEWNHLFVSSSTNCYLNQSDNYRQLLPVYENNPNMNQRVFYEDLEIGYSFNHQYGLEVFGSAKLRLVNNPLQDRQSSWVSIGLRTALNNHYFDF